MHLFYTVVIIGRISDLAGPFVCPAVCLKKEPCISKIIRHRISKITVNVTQARRRLTSMLIFSLKGQILRRISRKGLHGDNVKVDPQRQSDVK